MLGFDTGLTYQKLWKLCDYVRAGIPYIATHPDFNCPIETGFMPDIGATIAGNFGVAMPAGTIGHSRLKELR